MIITDTLQLDVLVEPLFENLTMRDRLCHDDYRIIRRWSQEVQAVYINEERFTEELMLHLQEEVSTLMSADLQDILLLVRCPYETYLWDIQDEFLPLFEKALRVGDNIHVVDQVAKNTEEQQGFSFLVVAGYGAQCAYTMHEKWVQDVVNELMDRLQVQGTIEQIMDNYNYTPKSLDEPTPQVAMSPPEYAQNEPWQHILASMCATPHRVTTSNACPYCGSETVELAYASPPWTRRKLCGHGGMMVVCPHCVRRLWHFMGWLT